MGGMGFYMAMSICLGGLSAKSRFKMGGWAVAVNVGVIWQT